MDDAAGFFSPFERRRFAVDSGEIEVFVAGEGAPLLYLHGRGGLRKSRVHLALAERFRVYLPVHPGFDGTDFHAGVASMPALAGLYRGFVERHIGGPCDVVGHSFGGWLAAWFAVLHGDLVQRLVLECPAGFRPGGAPSTTVDAEAVRRMLYVHPERQPPDDRPPGMEDANRLRAPHYHGGIPLDEDLVARLGEIACPALLVYGLADGIIPMETCRILEERIPGLTTDYIEDAGHGLEIDQPERVAETVIGFLEEGGAQPS
jgi:pimeloyl-ACP methyl ester carboxylesterase